MQRDVHDSVIELGFALARRRAVHERNRREGYTAGVAAADLESGCRLGQALGGVYRAFGYSDAVFMEAFALADELNAGKPA